MAVAIDREASVTDIERNEPIRFHEAGTLEAVTRWIANHYDGIAEWLKNTRRQYQVDRADVEEGHRVAVLLLQDAKDGRPARIGLLDVGGATLEDVTAWSTWQDPEASRRNSALEEEETQGNGGKAYMYRLFAGPARILGVRDRRLNCKGFVGPLGVDRGTPGWIPSLASGREVEISSFEAELETALAPFGMPILELPSAVHTAVIARQAFTLVEGEGPADLYKGRIDADDLIAKVIRHEQSTLCLEQLDVYAVHNGRPLNGGRKLVLPPITPYREFESPLVSEIPDQLPLESGQMVSTTEGRTKERGRLTLHTSMDSMPNAYKNLRPRWQIVYRTRHQMIGAKSVGELVPATPGAGFVYGTIELPALEPAYVEHGRRRPKDGPLMEAVDRFVSEKIRELAHQINDRRKQALDDRALDEVHRENRVLDELKNRFLPGWGEPGGGGAGEGGDGPRSGSGHAPVEWGDLPETLDCTAPASGIHLGKSVSVALRPLLDVTVRDSVGRPVRNTTIEWLTTDPHIASVSSDGLLTANEKGAAQIWARVRGTSIETQRIAVDVRNVDHVLLTPRLLEIPLGNRERVIAEVTDDDGGRSTEVLLDWTHDAEDPLIVRISRAGNVTANRLGRTAISAGAGPVWARIPVEVEVVPNPEAQKRGSGFPRLLLTGRDLDPATGIVREGDPDQPALWQEPSDYVCNVWWLNLQSPEAAFAFRQRGSDATLWRTYHADRVIDMVVQVWMTDEFTRKGEQQRPEVWAAHLAATVRHRVRIVQEMWPRLEGHVLESFRPAAEADE